MNTAPIEHATTACSGVITFNPLATNAAITTIDPSKIAAKAIHSAISDHLNFLIIFCFYSININDASIN